MFYIKIDEQTSEQLNLAITRRPSFPAPKRRYEAFDILGRDGQLYCDLEKYDDIEVEIEFNYIASPSDWHLIWRKCKAWLLKRGERKLELSDDLDYFYKIKKVSIDTNERSALVAGSFVATFTLAPYEYLQIGTYKYRYQETLYNEYNICHPTFFIKGEGMCDLMVNGNKITANIGQNLVIDTDLEISYRFDKTLINSAISGDYKNLYLMNGENDITITDGFELLIKPNWRCI